MFVNGFGFADSYDVVFDIYIGNQLVQSQQLSAPRPLLEAQFMQLVQQINQTKQPMQVIMRRTEQVWDAFEGKMKELPLTIEFKNWSDEE